MISVDDNAMKMKSQDKSLSSLALADTHLVDTLSPPQPRTLVPGGPRDNDDDPESYNEKPGLCEATGGPVSPEKPADARKAYPAVMLQRQRHFGLVPGVLFEHCLAVRGREGRRQRWRVFRRRRGGGGVAATDQMVAVVLALLVVVRVVGSSDTLAIPVVLVVDGKAHIATGRCCSRRRRGVEARRGCVRRGCVWIIVVAGVGVGVEEQ